MKTLSKLILCSLFAWCWLPLAQAEDVTPQTTDDAVATENQTTPAETEIVITDDELSAKVTRNFNFGYVHIGNSRYATFWIRNNSYIPLFVNYVSLYGQGYTGTSYCSGWLAPFKRCNIFVRFMPWHFGSHYGKLSIYTNRGNFFWNLYGFGY